MNKSPAFFLFLLFLTATSCKDARSDSEVKIDAGVSIDTSSANKATAMYNVLVRFGSSAGGCTGTAVSDDTLVFAAHCVGDGGYQQGSGLTRQAKAEVCVSNFLIKDVCTKTTFVPVEYATEQPLKMAHDVAISVFPKGTFKTFANVASKAVAAGDDVVLIGYSEVDLAQGKSAKRWGRNKVSSFLSNITIVSDSNGTNQGVGVSPGDSGGPMLSQCEVVGVASRMTSPDRNKQNLHTNLTWEGNQTWFKSLPELGAHICGVAASPEHCDAKAQFVSFTGAESEFPCAESGQDGTTKPADDGKKPTVSAVALAEANDAEALNVYFSATAVMTNSRLCLAIPKQGQPAAVGDCVGEPTTATADGTRGDLQIYKVSQALSVPSGTTEALVLVLSGQEVVHRVSVARRP